MSRAEITVAAVTSNAGRYLLVEEHIGERLLLNQPAGHVEPGETLAEAIVREVREETAWGFTPCSLIGVYLWRHASGRLYKRFTFAGTLTDHDPGQPLDVGIVATHWLTRAQIEARARSLRSPLVLRGILDYEAGAHGPLAALAGLTLAAAQDVAALEL